MKRTSPTIRSALCTLALAAIAVPAHAQGGAQQEVEAIKAAMGQNAAAQRNYTWVQTSEVAYKGEVKSSTTSACQYIAGAQKPQCTQTSAPPEEKRSRVRTPACRSAASAASRPASTRRSSSCSARPVQVCTGAMLRGYEMISELKEELSKFMTDHQFANIREFVGKSLPYFTTHHDLVDRQKAARDAKEAARSRTAKDVETWKGDIAKETSTLVTN